MYVIFSGWRLGGNRGCNREILIRLTLFAGIGKIQPGAHKRGLKPQIFRENRGEILPGKSGLFGENWRLFSRADRGLFGADRDQFLRTPQPRGKSRNCPKGPFLAQLAPFGLSPCLLSPRLDFPEGIAANLSIGPNWPNRELCWAFYTRGGPIRMGGGKGRIAPQVAEWRKITL